jgi:AcrR family transcriptional regulator
MKEPRKHETSVFAGLPEERKQRVLKAAREIFARDGYTGANVNEIAARANISVGALYKYFRTKEDLFLVHVEQAHDQLGQALAAIESAPGSLMEKLERLLFAAIAFSEMEPELVQLYVLCTTQELAPLAGHLSGRIESITADCYRRLLAAARRSGEISADVDPAFDAFCLDNLFIVTHFSYGTPYYRERLRIFCGGERPEEPQKYVRRMLSFMGRALGIPPDGGRPPSRPKPRLPRRRRS